MQLTLRTLAVALGLFVSATSCGDELVSTGGEEEENEEIEIDERLLGVFSAPRRSLSDHHKSTSQLHIKPDGTAVWISYEGCGKYEYRSEWSYEWRPAGFDELIITGPSGGEIAQPGATLHVRPGQTCDEIIVTHVRDDGAELYSYLRYRGELCLFSTESCGGHGCTGCKIDWCEEPPEPCE